MEGDFQVGFWLVSPKLNRIERDGRKLHLEPKAMQVLVCLAEQQGEVVSKEQLIHTVWADTFVTDYVLTHSISELRRAFEDDAKKPRVIETVPKGGYRLMASVTRGSPRAGTEAVPQAPASCRFRVIYGAADWYCPRLPCLPVCGSRAVAGRLPGERSTGYRDSVGFDRPFSDRLRPSDTLSSVTRT